MTNKPTVKKTILNHLLKYGSISTWDAISMYGCTRLSGYIYLLKKDGYVFDEKDMRVRNRNGRPVHYKSYILINGNEKKGEKVNGVQWI